MNPETARKIRLCIERYKSMIKPYAERHIYADQLSEMERFDMENTARACGSILQEIDIPGHANYPGRLIADIMQLKDFFLERRYSGMRQSFIEPTVNEIENIMPTVEFMVDSILKNHEES